MAFKIRVLTLKTLKEFVIPIVIATLFTGLAAYSLPKPTEDLVEVVYVKPKKDGVEWFRRVHSDQDVPGSFHVEYYKLSGELICRGSGIAPYQPSEGELKYLSHVDYANSEDCSAVKGSYIVRTVWTWVLGSKTHLVENISQYIEGQDG